MSASTAATTASTGVTLAFHGTYCSEQQTLQWHPTLFIAIAGRALWAVAETRHECEHLVQRKYRLRPDQYEIFEVKADIDAPSGSSLPDPEWPPKKTFAQELYDEIAATNGTKPA